MVLKYGGHIWIMILSWESSKIECVQTQLIKRLLGYNIQTSNIMARGEVGVHLLLLNIIRRVVGYTNNINQWHSSAVYTAFVAERNQIIPNFCSFLGKFDFNCINIFEKSKFQLTKIFQDSYDRFWWKQINDSPKAISSVTIKRIVTYEKYLHQIDNLKHKTTLSRFRLPNHNLLIEKGRHMRPRLQRNECKCFKCIHGIEDDCHFIINCPLYMEECKVLFDCCRKDCKHFNSLTDKQKFIFKALAKFIFQSQKKRQISITES